MMKLKKQSEEAMATRAQAVEGKRASVNRLMESYRTGLKNMQQQCDALSRAELSEVHIDSKVGLRWKTIFPDIIIHDEM